MVDGMENKGHVIVMDNYFIGVGLFKKLLDRGIYAIRIMRKNSVGLFLVLSNTKEFDKNIQGTMNWRMHDSKILSCVVWKDKKLVLLLSTHTKPIVSEGEETLIVPRRDGEDQPLTKTSPVHLEYTNNMRRVDVANHVRSNYSCQVRIHKWWHRVFFFLVDLTSTNMYVMYLDLWKNHPIGEHPLTHLQFLNELCKALIQNASMEMRTVFWSCPMPLKFMFLLTPNCRDVVLCARNGVNIITTYAIVNSIVSIRNVGRENTLQGIEV